MMRVFGIKIFLLAVMMASGFLVSCSKDPGTSSTEVSPTFTSLYTNVFGSLTCVNCHQPGGSAYTDGVNTLDFTSSSAAYNGLLATVQSPSNPSQCGSVKRVLSGSPTSSYLLGTLFSDYNIDDFAGSSGCRPYAHTINLGASTKNAIVQWIQNGAAQ